MMNNISCFFKFQDGPIFVVAVAFGHYKKLSIFKLFKEPNVEPGSLYVQLFVYITYKKQSFQAGKAIEIKIDIRLASLLPKWSRIFSLSLD